MTQTMVSMLLAVSMTILAALCLFVFLRRNTRLGKAFLAANLISLLWTAAVFFEVTAATLPVKLFFARLRFVGIPFLPVAWVALAVAYSGKEWPFKRWLALSVIPLLTVAQAVFLPRPNLFWGQPELISAALFPVVNQNFGFWYSFVHIPYSLVLQIAAYALFIYVTLALHGLYKRYIVYIVAAILPSTVTDLLFLLGYSPIPYFNVSPLVFPVSALLLVMGIFKFNLLTIVPTARDTIIEQTADAVVTVDPARYVVDANPAAHALFGSSAADIGKKTDIFPLAGFKTALVAFLDSSESIQTIHVHDDKERVFELRKIVVCNRSHRMTGTALIVHDCTARTRLYEKITYLAQRDPLTGVYNRRMLFDVGSRLLQDVQQGRSRSLAVALFDIDRFKHINDTYGHEVGDKTLTVVASCCLREKLPPEVFARLAGDEFVLLIPDSPFEHVIERVKRLHAVLTTVEMPFFDPPLQPGISMGLSSTDMFDAVPLMEGLLAKADEALYKAKREGRNQIQWQRME